MPYINDITPELAEMLLSYTFEEQRKLDTTRVDIYAEDMKSGRWRNTPEFILVGRIRDSMYLLAGQHRLSAIVKSGVTIPMWVEERDYNSLEEMRKDYVVTNKGKVISVHQAVKTLGTQNQLGINLQDMRTVTASLTTIASGFQGRQPKNELAALCRDANAMNELCLTLQGPIYAYFQALAHSPKNERQWGLRASVCSIGLITFYYQPEKAIEFWTTLFANDGLRKGEPQHTLRNLLADSIKMETLTPQQYAGRVAKAWNFYFKGNTLSSYVGTDPNTVNIDGTPFQGDDAGVKFVKMLTD